MSSHKRYFDNPYPENGQVGIVEGTIKEQILKIIDFILKNCQPTEDNGEGGLYVGTAGIAYMFYYLANSYNFREKRSEFLHYAQSYIESSLYFHNYRTSDRKHVAFLTGCGGVYAVAAIIYNKIGNREKCQMYINKYISLAEACEPIDFLENGSDELFVGRSGYIMGALLMKRELKQDVLTSSHLCKLAEIIVESGKIFRKRLNFDGDITLMYAYHGTLYLGAGHGICGILQTLLSLPDLFTNNSPAISDIQKSVEFLLNYCVKDGNMATNLEGALSLNGSHHQKMLVHWCHGSAGVIYMFARAYMMLGKKDCYLQVCREMAEVVWKFGLLRKGPGICHGVSGSGFVHLLMYRLTGSPKYLYRAQKFGEFMFTRDFRNSSRNPDRPYSLFEGWAGAACFLNDLMRPHQAEFPLLDIFLQTIS